MFSQILNPSCSIRPKSLNNLNYVSVYLWIGWWKILFTVCYTRYWSMLIQHIYFHEINKVGHISVFYKLILSLSITFIRYHARTWRYRHNRGKMFWLKVEGVSEMRKPCLSCPDCLNILIYCIYILKHVFIIYDSCRHILFVKDYN